MRILVIEDYAPLRRALDQGLREAGFAVDTAADGEDGLAQALTGLYDTVVLDLMLPRVSGSDILKTLRNKNDRTPVLILTARDSVPDRVHGLDLGADDYLVKPFAFPELLARIRALVRRRYDAATTTVRIADLKIDTAARTVERGGVAIALSAREYALLEYLAARKGQVVTRSEIWDHLYDFASDPSSNVIDVYIGYLRRKIDGDCTIKLIHTRRGQGYTLAEKS